MYACKRCGLITAKALIRLALLFIFFMLVLSGWLQRNIQKDLNSYQSNPLQDFPCSQICDSITKYDNGANCCDFTGSTCVAKATCLQSTIYKNQQDLSYTIRLLIIFGCSAAVAIPVAVFLWKKINRMQYIIEQMMDQRFAGRRSQVFNQAIRNSIRGSAQVIHHEPLLVESFLAEKKEEFCVICYIEFEGSKVVKLDCGHTYHRACIEQWRKKSKKCPVCRQQT